MIRCYSHRMLNPFHGTVNLVEKGYVDEFIEIVSLRYYNRTEKRLEAYLA